MKHFLICASYANAANVFVLVKDCVDSFEARNIARAAHPQAVAVWYEADVDEILENDNV